MIAREACVRVQDALEKEIFSAADARSLLAAMDAVPPLGAIDLTGERCSMLDVCTFEATFGMGHSPFGPGEEPAMQRRSFRWWCR